MNPSKIQDQRFWNKWRDSGAITNSKPRFVVKTLAELGLQGGGMMADISIAASQQGLSLYPPSAIKRVAKQTKQTLPEYEVLHHTQTFSNFLEYIRSTVFKPTDRCVLVAKVRLSNPNGKEIRIW